jgi:hypothetical protein
MFELLSAQRIRTNWGQYEIKYVIKFCKTDKFGFYKSIVNRGKKLHAKKDLFHNDSLR